MFVYLLSFFGRTVLGRRSYGWDALLSKEFICLLRPLSYTLGGFSYGAGDV